MSKLGDIRIEKYWDDEAAHYRYAMYKYMNGYSGYQWMCVYKGCDVAWATRNAKHYGIKVPTKEAE